MICSAAGAASVWRSRFGDSVPRLIAAGERAFAKAAIMACRSWLLTLSIRSLAHSPRSPKRVESAIQQGEGTGARVPLQ